MNQKSNSSRLSRPTYDRSTGSWWNHTINRSDSKEEELDEIRNDFTLNSMLKLESTSRSIAEIETIVEGLLERYKIERDLYPNILISLTEAVTNAINHGNCRDRSKFVHIESRCEGNELMLRVKDEGNGFNPEHVPDPTCPGNIETAGGRGVLLIKHFCHEAHYMDHGRTLEMRFKF